MADDPLKTALDEIRAVDRTPALLLLSEAERGERKGYAPEFGWQEIVTATSAVTALDSARDRLLAAVDAALKLIDAAKPAATASPADCTNECGHGPCNCSGVGRPLAWDLDPAALREAIARELTGKAADGG